MQKRLFSAKESAKYLGVGLTTFYNHFKDRLTSVKLLGNKTFYDKIELDALIEAHKGKKDGNE